MDAKRSCGLILIAGFILMAIVGVAVYWASTLPTPPPTKEQIAEISSRIGKSRLGSRAPKNIYLGEHSLEFEVDKDIWEKQPDVGKEKYTNDCSQIVYDVAGDYSIAIKVNGYMRALKSSSHSRVLLSTEEFWDELEASGLYPLDPEKLKASRAGNQ